MDHPEPNKSAHDSGAEAPLTGTESGGLTRRQLGVAAAWAAPLIAVAATAPHASASIENPLTSLEIITQTGLSGSVASGVPTSGVAGGDLAIHNSGPGWSATPIRARYDLSGPLDNHQMFHNGVAVAFGQILVVGGNTWTVDEYGSNAIASYAVLRIVDPLAVPADGSAFAEVPVLTFSATTTSVPDGLFPVRWILEVGARSGGDPGYSISDITGKTIPAA